MGAGSPLLFKSLAKVGDAHQPSVEVSVCQSVQSALPRQRGLRMSISMCGSNGGLDRPSFPSIYREDLGKPRLDWFVITREGGWKQLMISNQNQLNHETQIRIWTASPRLAARCLPARAPPPLVQAGQSAKASSDSPYPGIGPGEKTQDFRSSKVSRKKAQGLRGSNSVMS